MKTSTKTLITIAALVCGLAVSPSASATPRTELRASIDKARSSDPTAFRAVGDIVAHAHEADRHARGRKAPIALHLASLGSKALLPMLELVAFGAPLAVSVQRDLVEAIGLLRDPHAMPVLVTVLGRDADFETTRTAAEAVARLETAEAASALVSTLGKASGDRATAIAAGMGACHRAVIARSLADRLASHPDDAEARHVVKALGHVGNAWAWKTLPERSEEAATRETAARALMSAYVQRSGEIREAAAKALLVVDDVHTDALLEAARRDASADTAIAIDDLARRVAQNPTR